MEVVLASASKRRQELLKRIVNKYEIIISDFDEESIPYNNDISTYVMNLAKGKALSVLKKIKDDKPCIIIGCDTIVSYNNCILGKPKDKKEAYDMISNLSGNFHEVYSGIAIVNSKTNEVKIDFVCTKVKFSKLTKEQIKNYVETNEPMDKAGAYGIQGNAGVFVEKINGCYYNVVGLPLNKLYYMLKDMGLKV